MEPPKSLTRARSQSLLPKLIKKGRKNVLVWPKMTQEEADYILFLDTMFTFSEVASAVLGVANHTHGMQLVSGAEKIGSSGTPQVRSLKDLITPEPEEDTSED